MLKQSEVTNKLIEVEYAVTYPLNTTTISYDSNGNVKSRFSVMVWDFSSQISQINRRKTVNFNFIKNNDKELHDKLVFEAKLISYGLLYAY